MQNTETPHSEPAYTVIVDPHNARSIVVGYSDYHEAFNRFQREWLRIKDNGGAVYLYDGDFVQMENNTRGFRR